MKQKVSRRTWIKVLPAIALICAILLIIGLAVEAKSLTWGSSLIAMLAAWAGGAVETGKGGVAI